jgi:hypothetical protein
VRQSSTPSVRADEQVPGGKFVIGLQNRGTARLIVSKEVSPSFAPTRSKNVR